MSTADLLFELGTEELPAGDIEQLVTALSAGIANGLTEQGLPFADARCFSTPRRLAVLISDVTLKGPDIERTVVGPPVRAARNGAGGWTKAAEGFARKQGVALDALDVTREEQGVERIVANIAQVGVEAASVIPDIVNARPSTRCPSPSGCDGDVHSVRFFTARPMASVATTGRQPPSRSSCLDDSSGRESRGHRFHANHSAVSIAAPSDYALRHCVRQR